MTINTCWFGWFRKPKSKLLFAFILISPLFNSGLVSAEMQYQLDLASDGESVNGCQLKKMLDEAHQSEGIIRQSRLKNIHLLLQRHPLHKLSDECLQYPSFFYVLELLDKDIVKLMLAAGADPNHKRVITTEFKNIEVYPAIFVASLVYNKATDYGAIIEIFSILLENGADLTIEYSSGSQRYEHCHSLFVEMIYMINVFEKQFKNRRPTEALNTIYQLFSIATTGNTRHYFKETCDQSSLAYKYLSSSLPRAKEILERH